MKHANFVHLHLHTQFSLLDGAIRLEELFKMAKNYRMPALAVTDHGSMFGAIEFYQQALRNGIKPIIGCEVYVAPGSRLEKASRGISEASFHLVLLAKSGIYIMENLNLEDLSRDKVSKHLFIGLPIKIRGATGSPLRPIAFSRA